MRLFIAIELPEAVRLKLARLSRYLQEYWKEKAYPKTSWVRPENLHLTLKFLGEVAETEVPRICDQLRSIQTPGPINVWPDRIECLPPNGPFG